MLLWWRSSTSTCMTQRIGARGSIGCEDRSSDLTQRQLTTSSTSLSSWLMERSIQLIPSTSTCIPTIKPSQQLCAHQDLTTLATTWSVFSYFNLTPTSHTSDLNVDRVRLIYELVMKMDLDLGSFISLQISQIAQSSTSRLEFPVLITVLCGM